MERYQEISDFLSLVRVVDVMLEVIVASERLDRRGLIANFFADGVLVGLLLLGALNLMIIVLESVGDCGGGA
jgi:hypothetical protein